MPMIFVDRSAIGLPDATAHLAHLVDTGHAVILIGTADLVDPEGLPGAAIASELPPDPPRGSWFLTADSATCRERRAGVHTLLIGPRAAPSPRPGPRCDAEARDLATAVLEILSREAMG